MLCHLAQAAGELAERALNDPAFSAAPLWRGAPAETGAVARMASHPLLAAWIARRGRGAGARLLARLLELAELGFIVVQMDGGRAKVRLDEPAPGRATR